MNFILNDIGGTHVTVGYAYASFDNGKGKEFEEGKLTLEDVVAYAKTVGEPKQTSGKQELYEAIVNMYC